MSFILEASGAIGGVGARKRQIEVCFEKRNGIRRRRSRKTRCMYAVSKSCPLSATQGLQPPRLFCPWDSPGKNTRVGCHFLLQGILPDPGIKPGSLSSPALAGEFFTTSTTWEAHLGILPLGYMCPDVEAYCQGLNIPDHTSVVFCKRSLRSERFS